MTDKMKLDVAKIIKNKISETISDEDIHTSEIEKLYWNNKLNVDDLQEVVEEVLIFNRN